MNYLASSNVNSNSVHSSPIEKKASSSSSPTKSIPLQEKKPDGNNSIKVQLNYKTPTKKESITFDLPPKPKETVKSTNAPAASSNGTHYRSQQQNGKSDAHHTQNAHQRQKNQGLKPVTTYDAEFDFESSNAKFEKDATSPADDEVVYYQKSSFFDDISCEVKDRTAGNPYFFPLINSFLGLIVNQK